MKTLYVCYDCYLIDSDISFNRVVATAATAAAAAAYRLTAIDDIRTRLSIFYKRISRKEFGVFRTVSIAHCAIA